MGDEKCNIDLYKYDDRILENQDKCNYIWKFTSVFGITFVNTLPFFGDFERLFRYRQDSGDKNSERIFHPVYYVK